MPHSHSSKTDEDKKQKKRKSRPPTENGNLQLCVPSSVGTKNSLHVDDKASPSQKNHVEANVGQFNCQSCDKIDDSYMVMCDKCDDWHHFTCVNVTSSISAKDWLCPKCSKKVGNPPELENNRDSPDDHSLAKMHINENKELSSTQITVAKSAHKDTKSVSSSTSLKLKLKRLEEERLLKQKRDQEFLDAKYALLEEMSSEDEREQDSCHENERLQNWVGEQQSNLTEKFIEPSSQNAPSNSHAIRPTTSQDQPRPSGTQSRQISPVNTFPIDNIRHSTGDTLNFGHGNRTTELNSSQIASRHIMHKELPSFSGRHEEWPLFISCFENSTRVCGLSNDENLIRLQRCLKGKALEAVRAQLLYPNQLPNIISTLRMLYGRPEAIINSLITKIRSEPSPKHDQLESLISFALSVRNIVATMETSGLESHLNSPYLLQELVQKLPSQTKLNWGMFKVNTNTTDPANLSAFSQWLFKVAEGACQVTEINFSKTNEPKTEKKRSPCIPILNVHQHPATSAGIEGSGRCIVCAESCKNIERCRKFKSLPLKQKWNIVNNHSLCRTCLVNHRRHKCTSEKKCGVNGCLYKHHQMLHKYLESAVPCIEGKNCNAHVTKEKQMLFKILPVTLHSAGKKLHTYAFLDDGSSVSLIESKLADELKLEGEKNPLCLKWTSGIQQSEENSQVVNLQISGYKSSKTYPLSQVRTVNSLELPIQTMDLDDIKKRFTYLQGIPATSYYDIQPRILIGLDHCNLVNYQKIRESKVDEPVAAKTRLGWVVFGPYGETQDGKPFQTNHISCSICDCQVRIDDRLDELVKEYFQIENIGTKQSKLPMNANDERAQAILDSSTINIQGRYAVGLLWRDNKISLPNNRPLAERRLFGLEKRLKKNPFLEDKLNKQIEYYLEKGYARKLTKDEQIDESQPRIWYLPVFPVVNPNKPDKVRLVWDAAATYSGISLNSKLLTGPDTLPALSDVLFRFRQRKFAICGDIKEMFHQIQILKADQNAQRFLWRNNVTERHISQYPRAVEAITKNHYVDDYLDSLDTEKEAVRLAKEVIQIHESGGFEIRNFMSNSRKIIDELGDRSVKSDKIFENRKGLNESAKILGMWWSPDEDLFSFNCNLQKLSPEIWNKQRAPTKREVLRTLMSIFDPLGLISNFLVLLKILLQEIWRSNTEWDEEIKREHFQSWCEWLYILPSVEQLRIERSYLRKIRSYEDCQVELHTFVDASLSAYASVAYLRVVKGSQIECSLVASKSKVAPLKLMSVPRLELEAAVLGVRLAKAIVRGHSVQIHKRYFWSDSQTVLCWINSDSRRFKQFVAFRVGEILEESNSKQWRWVPSDENVADEATKWNTNRDFHSNSRWNVGPPFLYLCEDMWPGTSEKFSTNEEARVLVHQISELSPIIDCNRFNKWKNIRRVMAYVLRFVNRVRWGKDIVKEVCLTPSEIAAAENYLYGLCQSQSYPKEWALLKKGKQGNPKNVSLLKTSPLYAMSPYMDENNVIRIKGRIDAAEHVDFSCKRPIILPNNHCITQMIIKDFHERFRHRFSETVVNEIRQMFFIPALRTAVKKVELACTVCQIRRAKPIPPMMGDLPPARLKAFANPFSYAGVDYFGPMFASVGRRLEKRWGVLFTCLTVRAVHIEVAHSLSSDSCILAIKRFCSRRGRPIELWSDNGTNFKGANQELKCAVTSVLNNNEFVGEVMNEGIHWKFIPPSSPHMGGSWERLVRSIKEALGQITTARNPKDELLLSMMAEVELIINSRPLTYVPIDVENEEALTPNHFLLGSSNGMKYFCDLDDSAGALRKNWITCENFGNRFWKRWIKEYLPTLTKRSKWFGDVKPLAVGDVVVIVDENSPRNTWPKGRIIKIVPSKDGQIRSAVVKTRCGEYLRPATKIAVLEVGQKGIGNPNKTFCLQGGIVATPGNAST